MLGFNRLVERIGGASHESEPVLVERRAMDEDRASYSNESTWSEATEQPTGFERDHACAEDGMSLAGLSTGVWPLYDGVQSLQSLERARNLAADLRDGGRIAGAA